MASISQAFETLFVGFYLLVGIWGTVYGYGLIGERRVGNYVLGKPSFRPYLRWVSPVLVIACIALIAFEIWGRQITAFALGFALGVEL